MVGAPQRDEAGVGQGLHERVRRSCEVAVAEHDQDRTAEAGQVVRAEPPLGAAQARGQGHEETLLWDLTASIRAAAKDSRIRVLVLNFDQMDGVAGQPTMAELVQAIRTS